MGSRVDAAVLHRTGAAGVTLAPRRQPWRCASHFTGENHSFVDESCVTGPGLCQQPGACGRCACKHCARCTCVDRGRSRSLGRRVTLAADVCTEMRSAKQVRLPDAASAGDCRRSCEAFIDFSGRACTIWLHHALTRECVGHIGLHLLDQGWEPPGVTTGLARCSSPPAATTLRTSSTAAAARMLVLHSLNSWQVNAASAARIARAHLQASGSPHVHRVCLARAARVSCQPRNQLDNSLQGCNATRIASLTEAQLAGVDARALDMLRLALVAHAPPGTVGPPPARESVAQLMHRVVQVLTEGSIDEAIPGLRSRLERSSARWADRRRPRWLSNGCDIHSLVWCAPAILLR